MFENSDGWQIVVTRQRLTSRLPLELLQNGPDSTYSNLKSGSELLVNSSGAPLTRQVILVRPGGTMVTVAAFADIKVASSSKDPFMGDELSSLAVGSIDNGRFDVAD
jgi:hypothetical protein